MDPRLQRRIQRYGWDMASQVYDGLWSAQLADAHAALLRLAQPEHGQFALDVACGTGDLSCTLAALVGDAGLVCGCDISGRMIEVATARAAGMGLRNARFVRMDGEELDVPEAGFDLAVCSLGLMYMPSPARALRAMCRALRPGGRVVIAVWGRRARCGWSAVFPIVDAEVASEVCPLFFQLGTGEELQRLCVAAGFTAVREQRVAAQLSYRDADEACDAAFVGGPVAMAWARFDEPTRERVRERYLREIEPWRIGEGYRVPGEFALVEARR